MKKYLICIFLTIGSMITISCHKDFLDKRPLGAYTEEEVWSDVNLVQLYVNSLYRSLPHFFYGDTPVPSTAGYSAASDEGYATFDYEDVWLWNSGEITPDDIGLDGWGQYYSFIRDCNIFFKNIGQVDAPQNQKDELIGQVKFIRAWCYFALASSYGGVPLITKVYELNDNDFSVERNSYEDCMNFVVSELEEAQNLVPINYQGGKDLGRITRGAVMALKSRALLYYASSLNNPGNDISRWKDAMDAAKELIDLAETGEYSLYAGENYGDIFLDKHNSEIILSYGMNALVNPGLEDFGSLLNVMIGPNGYHGWSAYVPSQNLVDQFEMATGRMIDDPLSGYNPDEPYLNRDPRFYADILFNGAPFRERNYESFEGGLDSPQSPVENWNASLTGYNWRKYADEEEPISENQGTDQNWIIFRLAEVYLNYAEALYHMGNEGEARNYINRVRSRGSVQMPDITVSGNDLLKAIEHERQIELCFEGHRFFDVRRWKIAGETDNEPLMGVQIKQESGNNFSYSYFELQERVFNDANYFFPVPQSEINKNGKLEQNPGY